MFSDTMCNPGHRRALRAKPGFALVVTLSLMILLTVIAVGLLTLSGIALRSSSQSLAMAQARANARCALMLAIGQLQASAGPDQRITATANLAGDQDGQQLTAGGTAQNTYGADGTTVNGLAGPQAGTRYWTGVWGNNHAPTDIFTKTPVPVLLNWLVSGNETAPAFTTNAATGQITSASITAPLPPSMSVANLGAASTALSSSLTINNQPAVLLAGPNTVVGSASTPVAGDVDRYVAAPVVPIKGADGTTTVGGYAWWVGDEGVKARYDVVDPYSDKTTPATQVEARYRLSTPAHSGVELLGTTLAANYPAPTAAGKTTHEQLAKVIDMPQARLLSPSIAEAELKSRYHALSASSVGLLTDTQNGGLRQDLSYYMGQSTLGSPLVGTKIIPKINATDYSPANGPYWDHLYSFCNAPVTGTDATATVRCRPQTATQMGINPVMMQFKFLITTAPFAPADTQCKLRATILAVLANPYNVTLTAPAAGVDFFFFNPHQSNDNDMQVIGVSRSAAPTAGLGSSANTVLLPSSTTEQTTTVAGVDVWTNIFYGISRSKVALTNAAMATDRSRGLMDTVRFHLDGFTIPPGEAIIVCVKGKTQTINALAPRGTSIIAPTPNTVNLETCDAANSFLPSSGTFAANYYEATNPLVLPAGCTMQYTRLGMEETNNQKVDYAMQMRVGDPTGAGALLQEITQGDFLAPVARSNGPSSYIDLSTNGWVLAGYTFKLNPLPRTGPGNQTQYDYRIYQDLNIRGISLDRPYSYPQNSQVPCLVAGAFTASPSVATNYSTISPLGASPYWVEAYDISSRSTAAAKGVLFDLPRSDLPLFSLGQLQHASLTADNETGNAAVDGSVEHLNHQFGGIWQQPGYAVANSYSHPFVPRAVVQYKTAAAPRTTYFDISYLLNAALWDNYYFSSIPQSGMSYTPLNPRYLLIPDQATATQVRQPDTAQHLSINGAFNINSTDPEAWKAVLGGLNNINTPKDTATGAVFARSIWQPGKSVTAKAGTGDDAYTGVRRLTASELDDLAKAIVQRVRARGPFVSLAHFINRTLIKASTDYNPVINDATKGGLLAATSNIPQGRGFSGTLQAAIDVTGQTASAVNPPDTAILSGGLNDFGVGTAGKVVTPSGANAYGDRILTAEGIGGNRFADTAMDGQYSTTNFTSQGAVAAPSTHGRKSTAIPGWLMQGDVLQSIGSVLTARSDTFVIRSYGDARDASGKVVTARAWCEAVVQRVPDYLDGSATGNPANAVRASLTTTNQKFGRRFKLVSFRWLTPNDI